MKADSHSVFNTLILDDDPMDGSRSLRKRKSSGAGDEVDTTPRPTRKRRRPSAGEGDTNDGFESTSPTSPTSNIILDSGTKSRFDEYPVEGNGSPKSRSTRPRRAVRADKPLVTTSTEGGLGLVVTFRIGREALTDILSKKPKKKKTYPKKKQIALDPEPSHYPAIQATSFMAPFFSFHDRDFDDGKSKPYGGILSEAEADTSKTFPLVADRKRFEEARIKAEEDWKQKVAAKALAENTPMRTQKQGGALHKVKCINFGGFEIDTWYTAPYPEEFMRNRVLYICEFCLKYMNSDYVAWRHKVSLSLAMIKNSTNMHAA
jgi:histone acetyltransferase SAS3